MTYSFDDDPARIDFEAVAGFLTTGVYWQLWRTPSDIRAQLDTAWRVVGVYDDDSGEQVGFARAVSDGVCDAYLGDVYILPAHRGHGLGKRLVAHMIDEGPGVDFRWILFTSDAHSLYEPFGFGEPGPRAMVRPGRRPVS